MTVTSQWGLSFTETVVSPQGGAETYTVHRDDIPDATLRRSAPGACKAAAIAREWDQARLGAIQRAQTLHPASDNASPQEAVATYARQQAETQAQLARLARQGFSCVEHGSLAHYKTPSGEMILTSLSDAEGTYAVSFPTPHFTRRALRTLKRLLFVRPEP